MPKTSNIADAVRLASAVTAVGGTIPPKLGYLLSGYEVLCAPARTAAPERAVMDALLSGKLTEKELARLLPDAAGKANENAYRAELAGRAANVCLAQFHRELEAGGADAILAFVREKFDTHAQAIAVAKSLISSESTAEMVIESGEPELVTAWKELPIHLQMIGRITAIARAFGPRAGDFSQLAEYPLAENFRVVDTAVMCTSGGLVADSALFQRPDQGHRTSPFFRCGGLRLHSIEEARARYHEFAASEFDRVEGNRRSGRIGLDGKVIYDEPPPNPYREQVDA